MSAAGAVHAALAGALAGVAGLNQAAPGASVRASEPYAMIEPLVASDWGTKDRAGRELRIAVTIRDLAERAGRLHTLAEAVEGAVMALPVEIPDTDGAWRIVSIAFLRGRTASEKAGTWAATLEWRVRVLEM